jgi:hypothetical protein
MTVFCRNETLKEATEMTEHPENTPMERFELIYTKAS